MLKKNVSTVLKHQFFKFRITVRSKRDLLNFENIVIFHLQYVHLDATEISINIETTLYMFSHVLRKE